MLEFSVADEGVSIPENLREHIFNKFFRVGEINGEEYSPVGTGLGLAIAKGIVEAQGGRIWVENASQGPGARFVFTVRIGDE